MEAAEDAEEISALRRGEGNARVAEQEGEDGAGCRPEHQQREDRRDARAVYRLHEDGNDEARLRVVGRRHEPTPRHDADDGEVDTEIDHRDSGGADEYRARN